MIASAFAIVASTFIRFAAMRSRTCLVMVSTFPTMSCNCACPFGEPTVARSDAVIAFTSVAMAEIWSVTWSIVAGCVPGSVTPCFCSPMTGWLGEPGASSTYFSPRRPRFATCA